MRGRAAETTGRGSKPPPHSSSSRVRPSSSSAARALRVLLLAPGRQLAAAVAAEPRAEDEAAAAEQVERGGLARELLDAAARQRGDERAEDHALGRDGDRGQRDPRVEHRADGGVVGRRGPRGRRRPSRAPRRGPPARRAAADRRARRRGRRRSRGGPARGEPTGGRRDRGPAAQPRGGAERRSASLRAVAASSPPFARAPRQRRLALALLALGALVAGLLAGRGGDPATPAPVPRELRAAGLEALAYAPSRQAELTARAAAGLSHVLYAKSPGGATASARRTARWRPVVDRVAARHHVDPATLEALVLLESAGRPDARASNDLHGRGRPHADPRRDRRQPPGAEGRRRGEHPPHAPPGPRRPAAGGRPPAGAAAAGRRALRPGQGARGDGALPRLRAQPARRPRRPRGRRLPHGRRQPPDGAGPLRRPGRPVRAALLRQLPAAPRGRLAHARRAGGRLLDLPVAHRRRARRPAAAARRPRRAAAPRAPARPGRLGRARPAPARPQHADVRRRERRPRRARRRHARRRSPRPDLAAHGLRQGGPPVADAACGRCAPRRSPCCGSSATVRAPSAAPRR